MSSRCPAILNGCGYVANDQDIVSTDNDGEREFYRLRCPKCGCNWLEWGKFNDPTAKPHFKYSMKEYQ